MTDETPLPNPTPDLKHKIAFIIDNEVVEVLTTNEKLTAILLSEPTILDISKAELPGTGIIGYTYNPETNSFRAPEISL